MIVLTFQPRFARLVESGQKLHTIRAYRKRPIYVGDGLSLREWTGRPYMSPQRELRPMTRCESLRDIVIPEPGKITVDGVRLDVDQIDELAVRDGFESNLDMFEWFGLTHAFPFSGELIGWRP